MKYGFSLPMRGHEAKPDTFVEIAQRAEALDIDALWCSAHIIVPPQVKSDYANLPGAKYPDSWTECYWEPFSVLSFLAAHTQRINLGTSIIVLPMHNPFEVAKQVAEVDNLSDGRFAFGLGVGWFEEEFDVLGADFHTRGARTDEALQLMQALWDPDPVTFEGRFYRCEDAYFSPKPIQQPCPPIWVAGNSEAAVRRAAKYGDVWHPFRPPEEVFTKALQDLPRLVDEAGRAPDSVEIGLKVQMAFQDGPPTGDQPPTMGRPKDILDAIRRYQEQGVAYFVFDLAPETLDNTLDTMDQFAQEVRPKLED